MFAKRPAPPQGFLRPFGAEVWGGASGALGSRVSKKCPENVPQSVHLLDTPGTLGSLVPFYGLKVLCDFEPRFCSGGLGHWKSEVDQVRLLDSFRP